ncbi:MAG: hypothetical protein J5856_09230 [Lachnospiraceae bacterium]|nr:hypothetical protein [Lachnospiraceae bacterium]
MSELTTESKYGLNRGNLKMIALFCMTLDHFGVMILESWMKLYDKTSNEYSLISFFDANIRLIGRIAFPIFCFFIVEGLIHTRNIYKYALRLFLLAIISEIPFDMLIAHRYFHSTYQNVFWTLLIGLVTIYCINGIFNTSLPNAPKYIFTAIVSLCGAYLAEWLKTDYGCTGVLAIVLIYLIGKEYYVLGTAVFVLVQGLEFYSMQKFSLLWIVYGALSSAVYGIALILCKRIANAESRKIFAGVLALCCLNPVEIAALIDMAFFKYYNGEKGRRIGWLFYFYYPAHLLVLSLICKLVGLYR